MSQSATLSFRSFGSRPLQLGAQVNSETMELPRRQVDTLSIIVQRTGGPIRAEFIVVDHLDRQAMKGRAICAQQVFLAVTINGHESTALQFVGECKRRVDVNCGEFKYRQISGETRKPVAQSADIFPVGSRSSALQDVIDAGEHNNLVRLPPKQFHNAQLPEVSLESDKLFRGVSPGISNAANLDGPSTHAFRNGQGQFRYHLRAGCPAFADNKKAKGISAVSYCLAGSTYRRHTLSFVRSQGEKNGNCCYGHRGDRLTHYRPPPPRLGGAISRPAAELASHRSVCSDLHNVVRQNLDHPRRANV